MMGEYKLLGSLWQSCTCHCDWMPFTTQKTTYNYKYINQEIPKTQRGNEWDMDEDRLAFPWKEKENLGVHSSDDKENTHF